MRILSNRERSKTLFEIGLLWALLVGIALFNNIDSLRWMFVDIRTLRQTSGEVTSSKTEFGGTYGGWRFNIMYRYRVGEVEFVSSRVHFGHQAEDDKEYAQRYIEKYPVGKQVVVFYDPNDPENAVLEPTVQWEWLSDIYIISIVGLIAIFGMSAYYFIKGRK